MSTDEVIRIRKGLDIPLAGPPSPDVADGIAGSTVAIQPGEYAGLKPRLMVKEGDSVLRGTPVLYDKRNPAFKVCSPTAGVVREISLGPRRAIERVVIAVASEDRAEKRPVFSRSNMDAMSRAEALEVLQSSGLLCLVEQRPYARAASADAQPKAIFVNGMSTAPFQADARVVIRGREAEFQGGLNVLRRLTAGPVYLCLPPASPDEPRAMSQAQGVEIRRFSGPHPSGNSSVHIHHLSPIQPGETVWTIRAEDVVLIGSLFLTGEYPATRIVALGGPGVREGGARHYRVRICGELAPLLKDRLGEGEMRIICGDALSGVAAGASGHLPMRGGSLTVVPEDRARHIYGWLMPGFRVFSHSRLFVSTWLRLKKRRPLGTNLHGSPRPMIVTGLYDRYLPMRIWPDYLLRAILAKDFEEAVQLGLLEVAPEDFALPAFVCPSKMDLVAVVRQGLAEAEAEGI
ncbi:MAG: NADH:ubiquinone reductase (Na(+)-transporting) subunit A [Kiritimatiellae bacterium]|nr:NADH:ubiquinone reductase (Na(+)-transporting) subunit A [Kiritimatiellia bacterium]